MSGQPTRTLIKTSSDVRHLEQDRTMHVDGNESM